MRLIKPAYIIGSLLAVACVGAIAQTPTRVTNTAEIAQWARSGHANAHSKSFTYWNEAKQIPPVCATCHSGAGFRALYGFDGGKPGIPASPVPVGGVVDCETCHAPGLRNITEIRLPSGVQHPVTGVEAACLTCHQGRASMVTVAKAVGQTPDDQIDPKLTFINPHYAIAGASLLGASGALGYQYPGKTYEPRFVHAPPVSTCASCHEPHNLSVAAQTCANCHTNSDAKTIRISRTSYDGSGDLKKGIYDDITANRRRLLALIKEYARDVSATPIVYDAARHPYFYVDRNGDGVADRQNGAPVAYAQWTPRLLKATYNWKFVGADAGIHVHNPHYALQLLYDSAEDLSIGLRRPLTGMTR